MHLAEQDLHLLPVLKKSESQRKWLRAFWTTLALFVAFVVVLNIRIPSFRDPPVDFRQLKPGEIFSVHGLTRRQEGSVKLGFAETFEPPQIGVFGNHIIDHFGADAFGRPDDADYFFNYWYENLALPETYRFLRHLEERGKLPKKLIIVQITSPNIDNGDAIINWGNELPPDVLLTGASGTDIAKNSAEIARIAGELVRNTLHEALNYDTFLLGVAQGGKHSDRIVDRERCTVNMPLWMTRVPYFIRNLLKASTGPSFFCQPNTWQNAYRRDGSIESPYRHEGSPEALKMPPPVRNGNPLDASERYLVDGDEKEIARDMRMIDDLGRRHGIPVVFIITPVYETDRSDSVANKIVNHALELVPDIAVIDHRAMRDDPSLVKSPWDHALPKYYRILVSELRRRGLVD